MNTFSNNILDTVISEVNSINDKVKGLNFLEILKNNLIQKILPTINDQKSSLAQLDQIQKEINTDKRNLKILIKFLSNPTIISKKLIEEDTLFLSFNNSLSFDINVNNKNFVNILLHKNTGISLSKNTIINLKNNKNVLMFEIQNKDVELILTN